MVLHAKMPLHAILQAQFTFSNICIISSCLLCQAFPFPLTSSVRGYPKCPWLCFQNETLSCQHITPTGDSEKQIAAASGQTWPRFFFMDIDMQQLNLSGKFCTLLCFYLTDREPVNDQQNIGVWDWTENEKRVDLSCTLYRISAF